MSTTNRPIPLKSLTLRTKSIQALRTSQEKLGTAKNCPFVLHSLSDNRSFTETLHNKSNKVENLIFLKNKIIKYF